MKWITHQTGAILAACAMALPLPAIALAWAGAVAPDWIDQKASSMATTARGRQRIFNRIHRGTSHWLGWWLALLLGAMALPGLWQGWLAGFALGGVSHVMMDMLTPQGVPLLPFSRRGKLTVPICSTGKISEYFFLAALLCAAAIFWIDEIYLWIGNLRHFLK